MATSFSVPRGAEFTGDTVVTFASGGTVASGKVLACLSGDLSEFTCASNVILVVTDRTPFHPLNMKWPDQPGDSGMIRLGGNCWPVVDTITGLSLRDGTISFGGPAVGEIQATIAAHIVQGTPTVDVGIGSEVSLEVDVKRREALNKSHTACHLMALALNRAFASAWTKDVRRDSLGSPDFDATAIQESRIDETGSVDTYRLGKSLRKAGFSKQSIVDRRQALQDEVEQTVNEWVLGGGRVNIQGDLELLSARRFWNCQLPCGVAEIPCGGTHVRDIGEVGPVTVTLDFSDDSLIVKTKRNSP